MNPNQPLYDQQAISAYYLAGHSLSECQNHFGCAYSTAKRAVLKYGKLRSIKEGVRLRNTKGTRKHSLESRRHMSTHFANLAAARRKREPYRKKRSSQIHPILKCRETTWFKWLLAQADYTCAVTGERGCQLAVHHLYSVNRYPEKRWDESNVLVVKKTLHDTFHLDFMGNFKTPCTLSDWDQFLQQHQLR